MQHFGYGFKMVYNAVLSRKDVQVSQNPAKSVAEWPKQEFYNMIVCTDSVNCGTKSSWGQECVGPSFGVEGCAQTAW